MSFSLLFRIFSTFSKSTWCWQILTAGLQSNALSDKRWSVHDQNMTTRSEAENLHNQMDNLEVVFLTTMWDTIVRRCHNVSEYLQKVEVDLSLGHELITSLRDLISGLRDQFDMFEGRAKEMFQNVKHNYKADTENQTPQKTSRRVLIVLLQCQVDINLLSMFLMLSLINLTLR